MIGTIQNIISTHRLKILGDLLILYLKIIKVTLLKLFVRRIFLVRGEA
ncbi:hypothetical protein ENTCAN_08598 [Enterobacter cancerogenus ATCC 35316]|nr:hypothetical protein ENTCAN_08598 [Enterobacter cancerogenus ATCC 35316]